MRTKYLKHSAAAGHYSKSTAVKITTYNVLRDGWEHDLEEIDNDRKRVIPWKKRRLNVKKRISKLDPDILCLQEVTDEMLGDIIKDARYETAIIGKRGRSSGQSMQCAIVFKHEQFDRLECQELGEVGRFVTCTLKHKLSEHIFCVASVHPVAGESTENETFRVKQFVDLFRVLSHIHPNAFFVCGDFNTDERIRDRGGVALKNRVHPLFRRNAYENASGTRVTYHGWAPLTFDYIYMKGGEGTQLRVLKRIMNDISKTPIPSGKEGSDHVAVTVQLKVDS